MSDAIVKAWTDKGTHPLYHDKQIDRLRREWPVLYAAIVRHVEEQR